MMPSARRAASTSASRSTPVVIPISWQRKTMSSVQMLPAPLLSPCPAKGQPPSPATELSKWLTPISSAADWNQAVASVKPGDALPIRFLQRGEEKTATVRFVADPSFRFQRDEVDGGSITPAQQAFRDAWLGRSAS